MYKGYIYRHWLINDKGQEKSYIGQTIENKVEDRWGKDGKGYAPKKDDEPTKFYNAINKYGWDNFQHKVLLVIEHNSKKELEFWLNQWEMYYIEKYNSFYNGYNSTLGGDGTLGCKWSDIRRQKTIETLSIKMSGEKNPFYGKKHTEEARRKNSESQKALYKQGYVNPMKGRKHSDEHRRKNSEGIKKLYEQGWDSPVARKVICLETLHIFSTITEAQKWLGKGNISNHLSGKRKSAGKHPITGEKLHWMYYEDYLKLQNNSDPINNKIA